MHFTQVVLRTAHATLRWFRARHLHLAARSACASFSPVECSSSDSCGRLKLWGCSDPCFRGVLQPDCECPRYVRRKLGHAQRYRRSRHGDACAGKVFWVASCFRVVCVLLSLSFRLCYGYTSQIPRCSQDRAKEMVLARNRSAAAPNVTVVQQCHTLHCALHGN